MEASARTISYHDRALARHHRRARVRRFLFLILIFAAVVALFWGAFYSSTFTVTAVDIQGSSDAVAQVVNGVVREQLAQKQFGFLPVRKNVLFFGADEAVRESMKREPLIKAMSVNRSLLHTLSISVTERSPLGIWCTAAPENGCSFFDESGARWGKTVPSEGTLILNVRDERPQGAPVPHIVQALLDIRSRLGSYDVHVSGFRLPSGGAGDLIMTTTGGWQGMFHIDEMLDEQIATLEAYIMDRRRDGGMTAAYIDARIPGRLYVK